MAMSPIFDRVVKWVKYCHFRLFQLVKVKIHNSHIYIYTYSGMSDALEGEKLICFKQNGNGIRFVSKDVFILALISPNISSLHPPPKKTHMGSLQHSQVHDRPIAKLQAHNARWIHHPTLPGCPLELGSRAKKRQKCVRNWGFFLVKLLVF